MTAYKHNPTCIIPAAAEQAVNDYLERQGLGRCFSIAVTSDTAGELVKDTDPRVTHYATTLIMDDDMSKMVNRLLATHAGERIEKKFHEAMVEKGGKRDTEAHPYQIVIVTLSGQRTGLIDRIKAKYPDADAKLFKVGLSRSGLAPIEAYVEWFYASDSFKPILDLVINQMKRAEVFIGCRDGNVQAVKKLYGDPKYQDPNAATRLFARVWIDGHWDKSEVLTKLGLKVVS